VIQAEAAAAQQTGVRMMTVNDDIVISDMIPARFLSILAARDIARKEKS
jgi:RNA:NAD 2'-phosphotransferase (TPT1/KptA family)